MLLESSTIGSEQRSAQPLYFDAGGHRLFGWLHRPPSASRADVGVLICKPFGYEAICAHRGVRAFAEAAVAAGAPAMRFDYAGTGNSEDLPSGSEELSVWIEDVLAAARELQRLTGVARVVLLGIRLGALLATRAAMRSESVSGLILVAPVISGRRYLRELRTVQLAASDSSVVAPPSSTASEEAAAADEAPFEVSGFALSAATFEALARTDLTGMERAPAPRILVIDRDDLPAAARWSQQLSGMGADVAYVALAGIVQMVWTAPHFGAPPQAMIAVAREWLERLCGRSRQPVDCADPPYEPRRFEPPALELQAHALGAASRGPTERPVYFARDPRLFGVVTEPPIGQSRHAGVVLINDGATYHVGANRMNVSLARRWARHGYTVLRMDLAGLGESDARPGRRVDDIFPAGAIDDIRAAVGYLRAEHGCGQITVAGLCSGAYHALRSAAEGLQINRILLVNPQNFFWKQGMRIDELQLIEIVRGPSRYRVRMASGKNWWKLLRGQADVRYIVTVAVRHAWFVLATALRNSAKRVHVRLPGDLGRELQEIVRRDVQMVFVFARGEVGLELLRMQAGADLDRLGERCRIHIIDGADHIFSQSRPRQVLENTLSNELLGSAACCPEQTEARLPATAG